MLATSQGAHEDIKGRALAGQLACATIREGNDAKARVVAARREHLEQRESIHRLERRRSERQGTRGGEGSRPSHGRREVRVRRRAYVSTQAGHSNTLDRARRVGHDVDSGPSIVAPQRATLWSARRSEQGGNGGQAQ